MQQEEYELVVKWSGREFQFKLPASTTIAQLKLRIQEITNVLPKNQKLTSASFKGKLPQEEAYISSFPTRLKQILMIGTPEAEKLVEPSLDELPEVLNDFDYDNIASEVLKTNEENIKKLQTKIEQRLEIPIISQPRRGKKLLVLDLDYTLFDHKLMNTQIRESARPFLNEFLAAVWPHYDIVIWSQTSWRWLEVKLTELHILQNPNYQITFVLDQTQMFSVTSKSSSGEVRTHEVKALALIWTRFPDLYHPKNTVHIDDLSRNFALNPQNGLKIKAYKNGLVSRTSDMELFYLTQYLIAIAKLDDFSKLDHSKWKEFK